MIQSQESHTLNTLIFYTSCKFLSLKSEKENDVAINTFLIKF
jgi:hypothetical protein